MCDLFFDCLSQIDTYVEKKQFDDSLFNLIRENNLFLKYFFSILQNADYLEKIREEGFFRVDFADGVFEAQSEFLARVSEENPELVLRIILEIPSNLSFPVPALLIKALGTIPSKIIAEEWERVRQKLVDWIRNKLIVFGKDEYVNLVIHLSKDGYCKEALEITEVLFAIEPSVGKATQELDSDYQYSECLKKAIPVLGHECGLSALKILAKLLDEIARSLSKDTDSDHEEFYQWPRAIEDHPQNKYEKEPKDVLLFSIRDMADQIVSQSPEGESKSIKGILGVFGEFGHPLFKRLFAYVLWKYLSDENKKDLEEYICRLCKKKGKSPSFLSSLVFHHERYHLLEDRFLLLPEKVRNDYMVVVENGFDEERYVSINTINGRIPSEKEINKRKARDMFDRLYPIRNYLSNGWEEKFKRIRECNSFGVSDHPDFLMYMGEARWLQPESPIPTADLAKKSLPDLVSYIYHYQPPEDPFDTSVEGLSKALKDDFTANPKKYLSGLEEVKKLPPEYIRQIMEAMSGTINSREIVIEEEYQEFCFELTEWILDQEPGKKYVLKGPKWMAETYQDLHMGVARLVGIIVGTDNEKPLFPFLYRYRIWEIITKLSSDDDPSPKTSVEKISESDLYSQAVSCVRGLSIENAVRYALWVEGHLKEDFQGVKSVPEVFETLKQHLNVDVDPSPIVRSMYGHWFPWILHLSEEWAKDNASLIFMASDKKMFLSAWNAYIVYNPLYSNVFEVLKKVVYPKAVSFLNKESSTEANDAFGDAEMKLAEHLAIAYWWGKIEMDEPKNILPEFFKRGPLRIRKHFIENIGWNLKDAGKNNAEPKKIPTCRLKQLLEARLVQLFYKEDSIEELEHFGDWFASGYFDDGWGIDTLMKILSKGNQVEDNEDVMEHLLQIATGGDFLEDIFKLLQKMIETIDGEPWKFYSWKDHVENILKIGLKSEATHDRASKLTHFVGSKGFLSFRKLLEP